MRLYFPIAKVDAEERMVWGYASTETRDEQGEVVTRAALEEALGDYLRFANIREMHQLSAVGIAKEAAIDDKGLYLGAKIVDGQAWAKIAEGVYKGFSIGGRITERDPGDRNTITGLMLNEISLVDRPANPEAVFDYWKASQAEKTAMPGTRPSSAPAADAPPQPVQIWACGEPVHRHLGKAEAIRCLEGQGATLKASAPVQDGAGDYADPGYQPDGRKRYPLDSDAHIRAAWAYINEPRNARHYTPAQLERVKARIVAAWKDKIDAAGPPAAPAKAARRGGAFGKALADVGEVARIILELDGLKEALAVEAVEEGEPSPQPSRLQSIIDQLCDFLTGLVAEETAEIVGGATPNEADDGGAPVASLVAAAGQGNRGRRLADVLAKSAGRGGRAGGNAEMAKTLAEERAANAGLAKALGELVPRLDALSQRVEDIARQPLPPKTIARGAAPLSKIEDNGGSPPAADDPTSLAAAFARMSKEQQTLTLIKASHLNPIRPFAAAGEPPHGDD